MEPLEQLLKKSAELHHHLCPRQVIGVRMGMRAESLLGIELPQTGKRVLAIVETDGCFSDGVAVASNCWVGRRTMRVEDYGKVAVTFVDTESDADADSVTEQAWRISPHPDARAHARRYAPDAANAWETMLLGYQIMPDEELLVWQPVTLNTPVDAIISKPGFRVRCERCGEEIMNEREVQVEAQVLCRSCAGQAYYSRTEPQFGPVRTER